ncbi:MAG: hypothetical protein IPP55_07540 [Anaerolineales bacterium]|jgi:hypothetical protein|nr:hypothetical protein [Anaerolineales bacterium]
MSSLTVESSAVEMQIDQLTICSVSYRSASLLDLNLSLTRDLNPTANFHWLLVDNNNDFLDRKPQDAQTVQLLTGDSCHNRGHFRGSYHHALALNKALGVVSTRYLLVIDPDFFIFRKNWIKDVLNYMAKKELSFWGAPYYPDLAWKRRYFPTVSCMLIDLERVFKKDLDFTPELDEFQLLSKKSTPALTRILIGIIPEEVQHLNRRSLADMAWVILRNRWVAEPLSERFPKRFYPNVNVSRDTGFKIQNSFGRNQKYRLETLIPAYVNDLFTKKSSNFMNIAARMYALSIPEDVSIYPKKRNYSTHLHFRDVGFFDVRGQFGWEEFFWQGEPFAMHIKGGTRKFEDIGYDKLKEILLELAGKPV